MKELEQLLYARLIADTEATNGIVALLGSNTKILHGYERVLPQVPYLSYQMYVGNPGLLTGNFTRSVEQFVQFNIYAVTYAVILQRLKRLFDGYRFDVPTNYVEAGQVRGLFDFEGPDGYDESLEVQSKVARFRFLITPKAWNPIIA